MIECVLNMIGFHPHNHNMITTKDENINSHRYVGTSILRIYRRYIDGYFEKKILMSLKLIKIHENIRKIL